MSLEARFRARGQPLIWTCTVEHLPRFPAELLKRKSPTAWPTIMNTENGKIVCASISAPVATVPATVTDKSRGNSPGISPVSRACPRMVPVNARAPDGSSPASLNRISRSAVAPEVRPTHSSPSLTTVNWSDTDVSAGGPPIEPAHGGRRGSTDHSGAVIFSRYRPVLNWGIVGAGRPGPPARPGPPGDGAVGVSPPHPAIPRHSTQHSRCLTIALQ